MTTSLAKSVNEFEVIRRWFTPQVKHERVIVGVGDDGAVLRPARDIDIVSVVDTLVADVHFPACIEASDVAWRAVAVNLSDIAAMGATARWMTLALTLPHVDSKWLNAFSSGLQDASAAYDIDLVGGDTTKGKEIVISVQITGEVARDSAVTRSGANAGDAIYVTGTIGDAVAGLRLIQQDRNESTDDNYLRDRFLRPKPRVGVGVALVGKATAAIDISDGLYADLDKMMAASDCAAEIALEKIPVSAALLSASDKQGAQEAALVGGDDYELCFTAPAGTWPASASLDGVPITQIGIVTRGRGIRLLEGGAVVDFQDSGYRHFEAED